MKRLFLTQAAIAAIATASFCFVSAATAADENSNSTKTASTLSAKDKMFIKKAAKGGMKEVKMGEMGQKKAKSDEVKKIAERMVTDHTAANQELMTLAEQKGVTIAKKSPKVAPINGENFDRQYLRALQEAHQQTIADFEKEAGDNGSGEDADVKAWAAKTLPTLKEHLSMIDDALAKMK